MEGNRPIQVFMGCWVPHPAWMLLQDYIEDGTVEYYHLPRVTPRTVPLMQVRLYYLCLKHVRCVARRPMARRCWLCGTRVGVV